MFYRTEGLKEFMRTYPVTTLIVIVNLVVFLYTSLIGGLDDFAILADLGGIINSRIVEGEYYRIFTYGFIHNGFEHLLFNMFSVVIFGPAAERLLGKIRYIIFFWVCILTTFLFVFFLSDYAVGNSGFGFGLLGFYLMLILIKHPAMDRDSRNIILAVTVLGWGSSLILPDISIAGHLGGFLGGMLTGVVFRPKNIAKTEEVME